VFISNPRTHKNHPKFEGPFFIVEEAENRKYVLKDVKGIILPNTYPIDHLKIITQSPIQNESDIQDNQDNTNNFGYVQRILNDRGTGDNVEYLVKFFGDDSEYWIPEKDFNVGDLIQQYHHKKDTRRTKRSSKGHEKQVSNPTTLNKKKSTLPKKKILEQIPKTSSRGRVQKPNTRYV